MREDDESDRTGLTEAAGAGGQMKNIRKAAINLCCQCSSLSHSTMRKTPNILSMVCKNC